jgi:hypothetical protein
MNQWQEVPLTNSSQKAIVDSKNYPLVSQYKWYLLCVKKSKSKLFYVRSCGSEKILMHRLIMGLKKGDKKVIDHINFNTLDNREKNLRICTTRQNNQHRKIKPHSSKYKGVHKVCHWNAHIQFNGKKIHLGTFENEKDAARAYNKAAKKYFGEFAILNNV